MMYMFTVWFCVDACCNLYRRQALRSVWLIVIDVLRIVLFLFVMLGWRRFFRFQFIFQLALKKGLIGPKRRELIRI